MLFRSKEVIDEINTEVFNFKLTPKEIEKLNRYDLKISHLDIKEWEKFKENFVYNTNAIEGSRVAKDEVFGILKKKKVSDTVSQLAVILQPTPLESVMDVALADEVMPPKSTFFYPKLATGLVIHPLG